MSAEEVIDNYLLWELCKQKGLQKRIMSESVDEAELKKEIEGTRKEYREKNYSFQEKIYKLRELDNNPDYRLEVFEGCSWGRETVAVENLGTTLPRAGGLPPEVISKSIEDVVAFVKKADPEKYQSVKYIMSLKKVPDVLDEFLPWVLHPGNRASKQDRMRKAHGDREWNIVETWGMINDGNHRTIAKILANDHKEIECFVGRRRK